MTMLGTATARSGAGPQTARVRGRQLFADDLEEPAGTLHGALVRIDRPHTRLRGIDTSAALRLAGVERVVTAADFGPDGPPRFGAVVRDQPVLADEVTRYPGEPVALVLADTRRHAIAAARLVEVAAEDLPAYYDARSAMSADPIHSGVPAYPFPGSDPRNSNVLGEWRFDWGDVDDAARAASLILRNRYTVPLAHHFAIETYCTIAEPMGPGVRITDTVQHPFVEQRVVAEVLGVPLSQVHIRALGLGGSFGGKGYPKLAPLAALVCRLIARPVKIALTSEESFHTGQREGCEVDIETGFTADGTILFQRIDASFLVGAYADVSSRVVAKSGLHACGPYRTPAAQITSRAVLTTTPPTTAFRGFGATHLAFAVEGQMDEAAHSLGISPVALRLKNIKAAGEQTALGDTPVDGDWPEVLRRTDSKLGAAAPLPDGHGRGVAMGMKSCAPATTSLADVKLNHDGSVSAAVGTSEMGQGAVITFGHLVSELLAVPAENVDVTMSDTVATPFDAITASSRSLVHMGNALTQACESVRQQLQELAAELTGIAADRLRVQDGRVIDLNGESLSYADLLARTFGPGQGQLVGHGRFTSPMDDQHPLGGPAPFYEAVGTGVELSVDTETGQITLHRVVHVTDAGKVLNLPRATGLDDGGVVMALGLATSEQLVYGRNGLRNGSTLDYRIPSAADIPEDLTDIFLENEDGPGPFGSKGLGEGGILAIAPAISEAVFQCTGVRIRDLPITAEAVWMGIHEQIQDVNAS